MSCKLCKKELQLSGPISKCTKCLAYCHPQCYFDFLWRSNYRGDVYVCLFCHDENPNIETATPTIECVQIGPRYTPQENYTCISGMLDEVAGRNNILSTRMTILNDRLKQLVDMFDDVFLSTGISDSHVRNILENVDDSKESVLGFIDAMKDHLE